jgi:uncharacterized protein YneF (UPF0154 family)
MGFSLSRLFVKDYMNKDPEIRKEAVAKTKDKNLLSQMAQKDPDESVREAAKAKLASMK